MRCSCGPDGHCYLPLTPVERRREAWGFVVALALLVFGAVSAMLAGCKGGVIQIPADAPALIRSGTAIAISGGLAYLDASHPDGQASTRDAAGRAKAALDATLIPMVDGAATDAVLRSTIDEALRQLGALLPAQAAPFVRIGIDLVIARVALPDNPAGKLSPEARACVSAFLHGASEGLGAYLGGRAIPARGAPRGLARLSWER